MNQMTLSPYILKNKKVIKPFKWEKKKVWTCRSGLKGQKKCHVGLFFLLFLDTNLWKKILTRLVSWFGLQVQWVKPKHLMYYFVFCLIYFSSLNLLFNLKLKTKCSVTLRYQRFVFAISTSLICRGFFKNIFH
jgi:hypothetical protein